MEKTIQEKIIQALRHELEYKDKYNDSQWILALALDKIEENKYIARVIIKTNTSPYVDGTDIHINVRDGKIEIDQSYIEETPIFQGGEIATSIKWLEEINSFVYIQPEDPFIENKLENDILENNIGKEESI